MNNNVTCTFQQIWNTIELMQEKVSLTYNIDSEDGFLSLSDALEAIPELALRGNLTIIFKRNYLPIYSVVENELDWTEDPENWDELLKVTYAILVNGEYAHDTEGTLDEIEISGSLSAPEELLMVHDSIADIEEIGNYTEFYIKFLYNDAYEYSKWTITKETEESQCYELWELKTSEWSDDPNDWNKVTSTND